MPSAPFSLSLPPEHLILHDMQALERGARLPSIPTPTPMPAATGGQLFGQRAHGGGATGRDAGHQPCYGLTKASELAKANPEQGEAEGEATRAARTAEAAGCEMAVTKLYSPGGGSMAVAKAEGERLGLWRARLRFQSLRASLVLSAHALAGEMVTTLAHDPISDALARRARPSPRRGDLASLVSSFPRLRLLQRLLSSAPPSMAARLVARLLGAPSSAAPPGSPPPRTASLGGDAASALPSLGFGPAGAKSPEQVVRSGLSFGAAPRSADAGGWAVPASELPPSTLSEAFYAALVAASMVAASLPSPPAGISAGIAADEAGASELLIPPTVLRSRGAPPPCNLRIEIHENVRGGCDCRVRGVCVEGIPQQQLRSCVRASSSAGEGRGPAVIMFATEHAPEGPGGVGLSFGANTQPHWQTNGQRPHWLEI